MKNNVLNAVKITDTVWWVGAIDWGIKDFHGYLTSRGTTYNAYLVLADKITLVDTVKAPFRDEMLARIASVVDTGDISYIISNHSEMDHTGCLPEVVQMVKPEKVFASRMGVKTLGQHFHGRLELHEVADGESLSLGSRDVMFIETRMLHWPDSMFSYLPDEKLLFSNDAFGMHLASSFRFADEIDDNILLYEGEKYFANILLPYSHLVEKLLDKVGGLGLGFSMILPDHGPVWRTGADIEKVMQRYTSWAAQKHAQKALIVYDTMWNSTEAMARAIGGGISDKGVEVKLMSLKSYHRSDIAKEMLDCGALIAGSPTLNNNLFPTVADVMTYLKGLRPRNLIGAVFGSYGWSGESVKQLEGLFDDMEIERVGDSVSCRYVPEKETLEKCYELGGQIAGKLGART